MPTRIANQTTATTPGTVAPDGQALADRRWRTASSRYDTTLAVRNSHPKHNNRNSRCRSGKTAARKGRCDTRSQPGIRRCHRRAFFDSDHRRRRPRAQHKACCLRREPRTPARHHSSNKRSPPRQRGNRSRRCIRSRDIRSRRTDRHVQAGCSRPFDRSHHASGIGLPPADARPPRRRLGRSQPPKPTRRPHACNAVCGGHLVSPALRAACRPGGSRTRDDGRQCALSTPSSRHAIEMR